MAEEAIAGKALTIREATDMITLVTQSAAFLNPDCRRALVQRINGLICTAPTARAKSSSSSSTQSCEMFLKARQQSCLSFPWYLTLREWKVLMSEDIDWDEARACLLDRCANIGLVNSDEQTEVAIYATVLLCQAPEQRTREQSCDRILKLQRRG